MKTSDYSALMPDYGIFRELCLACGPSGFEDEPDAIINKALSGFCDRVEQDPLGNTLAYIGNDPGKKTLMLFAHKDEVGFLVTGITPEGLVRFENIGGIDVSVLCGRRVVLDTLDGRRIPGIISMRPVHVLSWDERNKMPSHDDLYIDVGATDRAQLDGILAAGCPGTFSPSFSFFGDDGRMLAAKAIDDRLGCAVLLELARHFSENRDALDANLVLAFTVREEIGVSGANTAAHRVSPDFALVLESTAASDLASVPERFRVARTGEGGAVSFMDRSTVYDRDFVRFALELAAEKGIRAQLKKFVSGGNDAGAVHRAAGGIRTLALSAPSRYIHSAVCVAHREDYEAIFRLSCAIAENISRLG